MNAVCKTVGFVCATGTVLMFFQLLDVLASAIPFHLTLVTGTIIRLQMTICVLVLGVASVVCFRASESPRDLNDRDLNNEVSFLLRVWFLLRYPRPP